MEENKRIIYSINIEDVQNVAQRVYGRSLNQTELQTIENKLGDYIPWYEFIESAIDNHLKLEKKGNMFDEAEEEE